MTHVNSPKVFLSYATSDAPTADTLAADLQSAGSDVFYAKWSIDPGESIIDRIFQDGLMNAKFFLVLLSPKSVQSSWVREEVNAAFIQRLEKHLTRLIPVIIEKCDVPLLLRSLKWVDLTMGYDAGLRELVKAIYGVSDKPPVGTAPAYVSKLRSSVGGLAPISSTVGAFFAKSTVSEETSERAFTGAQLKNEFPDLTEQEINDAIAELKQFGLIRTLDWLGTGHWRFGQAEPTYALYLHFPAAEVGYDPLEDIKSVANAAAAQDQIHAKQLATLTGLPPFRLNRAVAYLSDYGIVDVHRTMGTAPFRFSSLSSSHQTRRFVNENCV